MKRLVLFTVVLLLAVSAAHSQTRTSLPRARSIEAFRPVGEIRIFTFTHQAKDMGRLISKVEKTQDLDGRAALVISEKLNIDFAQLGFERTISTEGIQYVSSQGFFLGDDLSLGVNKEVERLHLRVKEEADSTIVTGYYTRGGVQREESTRIPPYVYAWDEYLLDQLDLWLAMHDIAVGDTIRDSIFLPQSFMMAPIVGTVDTFYYEEIYQNKFDSVFIIKLTSPQQYVLHYASNRRLVRTDLIAQSMRVYLDYVGVPTAKTPPVPSFTFKSFVKLIPRYIIFILAGLLSIVLVSARGFKWPFAYVGLLVGGVTYVIVTYGLMPLQAFVILRLPALSSAGWGAFLWWIVPSLIFGVGEEVLKALAIYLMIRARNPRLSRFPHIGAFVGAGFGIIEASYMARSSAALPMFGWSLFEEVFLVLFHTAAGALIGYGFSRGWDRTVKIIGLTIVLNTILRYTSIFALKQAFDPQIVSLGNAFIVVVLLLGVIMTFRKAENSPPG